MPWSAVQLKPGVDTQMTLAANIAGISQSQLIRYKEGLVQTVGGWQNLVGFTLNSTVRDLHAWLDITGTAHLSAGCTNNLVVLTAGSAQDITPQTVLSNFTPNFSVTNSSFVVTVVDNATPNVSAYNTVYFNTPVALSGFLLNGAYKIQSVLGASTYTINATQNATSTITSSGILPIFNISSGSQAVKVTLPNNGFQAIPGLFQQFIAPTTVGVTVPSCVAGKYQVVSVLDSTTFTINMPTAASTTAQATMNASLAQILYYVTLGPAIAGSGFGAGPFGGNGSPAGGFGSGSPQSGTPGTPITTTDWTQDNFGEVLLACPTDGPIYAWSPDFGFQNSQVVTTAPFFNGGVFVSMPQQIVVAWRSVESTGVQDPLVVRWANAGDYTNWVVSNQTTAGSFHIPTGSRIIGGMQCPLFGLISTDIDVWTMTYVGGIIIFNFNRVGTGCGWIGSHACGLLGGNPYWMGTNNFFTLGQNGVVPLPCTVWDQVFQNLQTANQTKVRAAPNSAFNEMAWFYPSASSAGEDDSYVKVHIEGQEFEWDYGALSRTAWIDISVLGMPTGADANAQLFQHEMGTLISGAGLPTFRTGWFTLTEGQDIPFVDFIIPDFIWGTRAGAQTSTVSITYFGCDYLGGPIVTYGPFIVAQSTQYVNVRMRNKFLSLLVQSNANSEFWRLGRIRFRVAQSGRR